MAESTEARIRTIQTMDYLKLLRVKHYIKNLLVFLPLFFGQGFFDSACLKNGVLGFLAFCAISSSVYILNDYRDIEKDRRHPTKKNRPLASGRIRTKTALVIMAVCIAAAALISVLIGKLPAGICLLLYYILNVAYSMGLKNRPIIDIVILASGFVIRVFYGGFVTGIPISNWLYLMVITVSLYMGLGKRRNELRRQTDTREVLKYYTIPFLDKNMYVCVALAIVFYALWTIEMSDHRLIWTVPLVIIILLCYSFDIEGDSDGDPVEVILHDKVLLMLGIAYVAGIFLLLYIC